MKKISFLISLIIVICVYWFNIANAAVSISPLKHELIVEQWESSVKTIKITNESESAVTLYTSTEDFISWDSSGQPKFLKPEDQENPSLSLANWVQISEKNITLTAWETREISFKITVPEDWEPGWHYWAIFFSPWIQGSWKVAFAQRIWVLVLIEVPWETIIDWEIESFKIWKLEDWNFTEQDTFSELPVVLTSNFVNKWNIHLKPSWKIELIDEDWEILKNIGKETLSSANWTFIWEKLVDYIPVNDFAGNVLPYSNRIFESQWKGFGYTVLNDDWTKKVEFKSLDEYYADKAAEKQEYLMFWEQIHTKKVKKKITANFQLYYESKNKEKKEFNKQEDFYIEFNQKYIWLNYYMLWILWLVLIIIIYFIFVQLPKNKIKKEEELRKKIMEEMKKNK